MKRAPDRWEGFDDDDNGWSIQVTQDHTSKHEARQSNSGDKIFQTFTLKKSNQLKPIQCLSNTQCAEIRFHKTRPCPGVYV